jgi:hypothetical protein
MLKYSQYPGKFKCKKCEEEVDRARFYIESYDLTWMCKQKHLSRVNLYARGY